MEKIKYKWPETSKGVNVLALHTADMVESPVYTFGPLNTAVRPNYLPN